MYLEKIKSFTQDASVDARTLLDTAFIDQLLSGDIKGIHGRAGGKSGGFTKRYNIERESFSIIAMRLNKEFVLSSKAVETILKRWDNTGECFLEMKRKSYFSQGGQRTFAGALYQTLFYWCLSCHQHSLRWENF